MRPIALLTLLALGWAATPLRAQDIQEVPGGPDGGASHYILQFDEEAGERLDQFIDLAKVILQRPINYNPQEVGDTTIFIKGPIRVDKARFFQFFQAVLKAYDYIVMDYGPPGSSFLRIQKIGVGAAGSRGGSQVKANAPIVAMADLALYKDDPATLITTSIPLRYIDARSAMASFNPFFDTQIEGIRNVENSNSLVITGFGTNVWGAFQLVGLVDVPPFEPQPHIRKRILDHTSVDEIETILTELLAAARGLRPGQTAAPQQAGGLTMREIEPRIIVDSRANAVLMAGEEDMVDRIEGWIDILDVEVEPGGYTHVYRLQNTDANSMEQVLNNVLNEERSNSSSSRPGQGTTSAGSALEIPASVVADEISNSLVITASDRKYAELLETLRQLDVRRRQVLVEAAIVETKESLNEVFRAGVALGDVDDGAFVSNFGTPLGFDDTGNVDIPGSLSSLQGTQGGNLAAFSGSDIPIPLFLQWVAGQTKTRVLSRPSVLTNDNEEAEFATEQETSYETSSTTQNGVTSNNFEQVTAGIRMNVSPTISAGNYLRLRVRLEVSDFQASQSNNPDAPPDVNRREFDTPITVPDGKTVIIGGLVNHAVSEVDSEIPWLSDLPLIGWLFRADDDSQQDTFLYVFITAHIIDPDFALLDEISAARALDVERLGGDVRELSSPISPDGVRGGRPALAGIDSLFEMPVAAVPPGGPRDVPSAAEPDADGR
jgi:type II secretion system protein D